MPEIHPCRMIRSTSFGNVALILWIGLSACAPYREEDPAVTLDAVEAYIEDARGEIAVVYQDLGGKGLFEYSADVRMHAASTMKVPVMIQLFQDQAEGRLSLEDSIAVRTGFSSIADGSAFTLSPEDDSDQTLYTLSGQRVTYRHLIDLMITVSSNLATNILIEEVGAARVTASMRALGADSIQVLRGVEDGPAFRAGLSNTTTARDLAVIFTALARGEAVSKEASEEMLAILGDQRWKTKIPAQLPPGVRVAHKTGRITGISHDAGVVFPAEGPPFTLAILTRGFDDADEADRVAASISRMVYDYHLSGH